MFRSDWSKQPKSCAHWLRLVEGKQYLSQRTRHSDWDIRHGFNTTSNDRICTSTGHNTHRYERKDNEVNISALQWTIFRENSVEWHLIFIIYYVCITLFHIMKNKCLLSKQKDGPYNLNQMSLHVVHMWTTCHPHEFIHFHMWTTSGSREFIYFHVWTTCGSHVHTQKRTTCQQVVLATSLSTKFVAMLLFCQVVPSLWLTTCWQVVDLQPDNKLLEQLVTRLLSSSSL